MLRRLAATVAAALVLPASALAAGGDYVFENATPAERSTVRAALNASSFDWGIVPKQVTIHVGPYGTSHATPGHIWLDRGLLKAGRFAWATVMDEYAHQVDFFVLDPERRALLQQRLGGAAWCYELPGVGHTANGCERFASMIAWAYWPVKENSYRPESASDESAAMPALQFRLLLSALVGAPSSLKKSR
ncbi:MAG TPA: hypothetical protein VML35_07365 [Gaiellaceae bacterium]|nr:hypothetical protein [Gaiellaceae bacterium]